MLASLDALPLASAFRKRFGAPLNSLPSTGSCRAGSPEIDDAGEKIGFDSIENIPSSTDAIESRDMLRLTLLVSDCGGVGRK